MIASKLLNNGLGPEVRHSLADLSRRYPNVSWIKSSSAVIGWRTDLGAASIRRQGRTDCPGAEHSVGSAVTQYRVDGAYDWVWRSASHRRNAALWSAVG